MRKHNFLFLFVAIFAFVMMGGCRPTPSPTITPATPTLTPPVPSPTPLGKTILVTSTADNGPGTLRQALLDARAGDIITFDVAAFPQNNPVAIKLASGLPSVVQGYLTLNASHAGVVLDGSQAGGDWTAGIEIDSEHNVIKGLQIVHFSGPGITLNPPARFNIIGGDRNIGLGPLGEGNLIGDTSDGIAIWGSDNVIVGNLIGTDVTGLGKMGNRGPGIFLEENASRNIIGPNNVIAYNGTVGGGGGVEIRSVNARANTITANSIHDNSFAGIYYNISGSIQAVSPIAPIILDFDLASGMIGGITCPGCVVEVFSTSKGDGEFYEGSGTADQDGSFSLSTGASFTGPNLTATSIAINDSTSTFSVPTSGARRSAVMQEKNTFPRNLILSRSSQELQDTRIGGAFAVTVDNLSDPAQFSRHSAWLGNTWICLTFGEGEWSAVQSTGRYSPVSLGDSEDQVIDHLNQKGVIIVLRLIYFDEDLQAGPGFLRFKIEQEIQDYLDYARMVATHFRGRVQYYETWNEPELMNYGQQSIAVEDYINVIRRLVPVIHAADPQAKVVVAGGSDLRNPHTQAYLTTILESDIMPLVDGIAIHPMYGSSPDYDELRQYYYEYPALIQRIKDTASAHGFAGEFFAEEMTWRTSTFTTEYEVWTYTQPVAAKYYARGIVINRGLGLYAGIGGEYADTYPEVVRVVQNLNTVLAGAEPAESLPMQIESEAANIRSYSFSLSNSDYLVALWTDGVAVDDDPGVNATLNFPGLSVERVVGIDILNSFEQELIIEAENGNVVIRNLLIKDYPIILRLTK